MCSSYPLSCKPEHGPLKCHGPGSAYQSNDSFPQEAFSSPRSPPGKQLSDRWAPWVGCEAVSGPGAGLSQCCSDSITPFPSVCSGNPFFGLSCPPSGGKFSWWFACPVSLDPHLHVPLPCPPSLRLVPPITAPSLLTQGWSETHAGLGIFQ